MDIGGIAIADDQAKALGFVVVGVIAAIIVLSLGRRTRRLILGLVVSASIVAGLMFAVRTGAISDPWGLLPTNSS